MIITIKTRTDIMSMWLAVTNMILSGEVSVSIVIVNITTGSDHSYPDGTARQDCAATQSKRIVVRYRTAFDIGVKIVPSCQSDWILRHEATDTGVIVARAVVVEARTVVLPPAVLRGVGIRLAARRRVAIRLIRVARFDYPTAIGEHHGAA